MNDLYSKDDEEGGTAFPTASGTWAGMSLRDYFAGQVIVGLVAYRMADAMIEARRTS